MLGGFAGTVADIEQISVRGPWDTKSGAELSVLQAFTYDQVQQFFTYNPEMLARHREDIRGLRTYTVRGIPEGKMGGGEFHKIRQEILIGLEGLVDLRCEDIYGGFRNFVLDSRSGVMIPPYMLHTYRSREHSGLLVIANTLYDPDNPETHDTYSREEFETLQQEIRQTL
ncbi:WxcM-like domain-containing protein [Nanoarchaeota archaeon]